MARARPFGVGGFDIEAERGHVSYDRSGPGVTLGGGLLYFLTDHLSLDAAIRAEMINWDEESAEFREPDGSVTTIETPIDIEDSATKLLFGAGWWF